MCSVERSPEAGERKRAIATATAAAVGILADTQKAEVDRTGAVWSSEIEAARYDYKAKGRRWSAACGHIEGQKPWADFVAQTSRA